MMDSMFKGSGLNLIIEINHNHGGLVVVEGDEISHEQHLIVRWLILTEFRFFFGVFLQPERLAKGLAGLSYRPQNKAQLKRKCLI